MNPYHVIIFVTGGITLALELLVSRVLTPYFGVSLFIWSGILSITLIALAVGYWWGGRLAQQSAREDTGRLSYLFALMPAASAVSIVFATLLYPTLFYRLAQFDLVVGAFAACLLLLFVPLVTVSAMNPLLVAISMSRGGSGKRTGDAGAGYVFFVSTIGSVVGVLITAFVLIPNITNFRSLLVLALGLALVTLYLARSDVRLVPWQRRRLALLAGGAAGAAILLLVLADRYLGKSSVIEQPQGSVRLVDERPTFFGNIKIVDAFAPGQSVAASRVYLVDGLAQCVHLQDREPGSAYTYCMEAVGRGQVQEPRKILVLGLGGGVLPMRFARPDTQIDVVEINPVSVPIAEEYFGYNRTVANHHLQDARVYVRRCSTKYDLIFADLFHGDSTPEYLLSAEFMSDLSHCLAPGGCTIFNMVGHTGDGFQTALASYVKTVQSAFPHVRLYHPARGKGICNLILAAGSAPLRESPPATLSIPARLQNSVAEILVLQSLDPATLAAAPVLTDDYNVASLQQAWCYLQTRIPVLRAVPAPLLVN